MTGATRPLRLVRYRDGEVVFRLDAACCETTLRGAEIVCRRGVIERAGRSRRFGEARYDGRRWQIAGPASGAGYARRPGGLSQARRTPRRGRC